MVTMETKELKISEELKRKVDMICKFVGVKPKYQNGKKSNINTKKLVKVYTFLDGTNHILYNNEYYDLKSIKNADLKPETIVKSVKSQEEINASKTHKPSKNHPWKNVKPFKDNIRVKIAYSER